MNKEYIYDTDFKGENYTNQPLKKGEYENCTFADCIFSNTDLSEVIFSECEFENCDLSLAKLRNTAFRSVKFKNCKLLGLHFDDCSHFLLSFDFEACVLNYASFFKLKLKNIHFKNCTLEEVDFVETDLTNSSFKNCNLHKSVFENTNLEGADLRTAANFSINPEINRIKKAKFSTQNVIGLLDKYGISIE